MQGTRGRHSLIVIEFHKQILVILLSVHYDTHFYKTPGCGFVDMGCLVISRMLEGIRFAGTQGWAHGFWLKSL